MAENISCNALQVLDRMLEFFADDGHWLKGAMMTAAADVAWLARRFIFCHAWDLIRPRAVSGLDRVPRAAEGPAIFQ